MGLFCQQVATNGVFIACGKVWGIISRSREIPWLRASAWKWPTLEITQGNGVGLSTLGHIYIVSYSLQTAVGQMWENIFEMLDKWTWCWPTSTKKTGSALLSAVQQPRLANEIFWYLVKLVSPEKSTHTYTWLTSVPLKVPGWRRYRNDRLTGLEGNLEVPKFRNLKPRDPWRESMGFVNIDRKKITFLFLLTSN